MIDQYADEYVAQIKRDTLKLFPEKRIPYCVWCRETLERDNLTACCSVCDSLHDRYIEMCQINEETASANGFAAYVEAHTPETE